MSDGRIAQPRATAATAVAVAVVVVVTWKAADSAVTLRGSGQGMDHFFTTIWQREHKRMKRRAGTENKS